MKIYQEHDKAVSKQKHTYNYTYSKNKAKQGTSFAMEKGKEALGICCFFPAPVSPSMCTLFES